MSSHNINMYSLELQQVPRKLEQIFTRQQKLMKCYTFRKGGINQASLKLNYHVLLQLTERP